MEKEKIVIIGGGPAGLTAGIYSAMANLSPLLFEGPLPGGQLTETTKVENFPGFPDGVYGTELMMKMKEQAERMGVRIISEEVVELKLTPRKHIVKSESKEVETPVVIIATGAKPRKLGIKGEPELTGKGVSYCATCDGFFFRNKSVAVVGGGDAAFEEALYLAGVCRKVTLIHRRNQFRAAPKLVERVKNLSNVDFLLEYIPVEFIQNEEGILKKVLLRHTLTREEKFLEVDGIFVAIGHIPSSELVKGQLDLDEEGYILTEKGGTKTSMEGVFAAGDVQDRIYRQAVTAAATGCMAVRDAIRYLEQVI